MAATLRSIATLCLLLAFSATLATAATTPPTQCGGSCLWQTLGFNPFTRWNVFSLSTIGTSELPFGGTIEGTVASVGSSWFKAISIHTGEPASAWSATAGGNFTLLGGSVLNGGVEAGGNVVIESADVAGDVNAVNGAANIGSAETGVTIQGKTSAKEEVNFSAGSSSKGGVATTDDLKLSVDLEAVATYFKQQSEEYARAMDHNIDLGATSVFISENGNDIIVEVHDGLNFLTLDAEQLVAAQRIQLNGGADSVLVINVAGKNITLKSLEVFSNGMTDAVTTGRVLLNLYQAEYVTIEWGSGAFSTLAPLAATVYKSGSFSGSWVVGSLVTQWQGGVEFGYKPWAAVCAASEDCGESNPGEVSEQIAENV